MSSTIIKYTSTETDNLKDALYRKITTLLAEKSYIKSRCGVVIVNKNKILSSGYNLSLCISSKNESYVLCS